MPKVHVYIRANDWERLSQDGTDPSAWTRQLVKNALERRLNSPADARAYEPKDGAVAVGGHGDKPRASDPATSSTTRCERRHPMIPAERCTLVEGHLGSHSWSDR